MSKEQNVLTYYTMCNKLKNVIRSGWLDWNVSRQRVESIAEHVFSVQMLAIAMWSEYHYDVDIAKVLSMLAVHEMEEIIIGDLTLFQVDKAHKDQMGHKAIKEVLAPLSKGSTIEQLILEFDAHESKESIFAYQCDKLDADLQCRLYDEEGCVDLHNQQSSNALKNGEVKKLLNSGMSWSEMWLTFGQRRYPYDDNFIAISNYAKSNKITKKDTTK